MSGQASPWKHNLRSSDPLRKDQDPVAPHPAPSHGAPTSFFLATEDMLTRSRTGSDNQALDSTFGVKSIPDETEEVKQEKDHDVEEDTGRRRSTLKANPKPRDASIEEPTTATDAAHESPPFGFPRLPSTLPSVSSFSQGSQGINPSLPGSPKSTSSHFGRPSDDESVYEGGSQAIASSEEDAEIYQAPVPDISPQLIMPSIQMPSRRPFTGHGRSLDRLKILVAGDSGKTSLIKSIVQLCEDIVHVDPMTPSTLSTNTLPTSTDRSRSINASCLPTTQIHEVWASTKAYPGWWTDLEENRALRRRKSIDDPVLERNICFVDTPGYGRGLSIAEGIETVISYIEEQLPRSFSGALNNKGELVSMLSGNGGTQVDAVLYLIGKEIKPADLDFLQRLSQVTNVIPLLAQADQIETEHVEAVKKSISNELNQLGVQSFSFKNLDLLNAPYAVCSTLSNDEDNMDASLLMSSDYIQPLLPSELRTVVDHLFEKDNMARLRYLSAKKLVQSKTALQLFVNATTVSEPPPQPTYANTSSVASQILVASTLQSPLNSQHRLAEHTRREEKLARIRLAKWANDLRKTMRDERAQYETLHHVDRTTWLSQKLEECSRHVSSPTEKHMIRSELTGHHHSPSLGLSSANDPLGLLRCDEYLRRHGLRIFQVVGTFGVVGAVAVWAARNWPSCSEWSWTWGECRTWTC
ncbi:MAG: hypothetical protein Q9193_006173 [Seirophora villosa]